MIVNKNCFSDKFVGTSTLNNYLEGSFTSVFKFTIVLHNRPNGTASNSDMVKSVTYKFQASTS